MDTAALEKRIRKAVNSFHKDQKKGFYAFAPYENDIVLNCLMFDIFLTDIVKEFVTYERFWVDFLLCSKEGSMIGHGSCDISESSNISHERKTNRARSDFCYWRDTLNLKKIDYVHLTVYVAGRMGLRFYIYPDCIIEHI